MRVGHEGLEDEEARKGEGMKGRNGGMGNNERGE